MNAIGNRVREIRKEKKLTQKALAEKLGMSENYIWQVEKGERSPSDRTIADICRVFGVNDVWLRTGVGEMYAPKSRKEELSEIFADVMIGQDDKSRLIRAMARMPDEAFPAFCAFLRRLSEQLKEE